MLKKVLKSLGVFIGICCVYLLGVFLLPYIPVAEEKVSDPQEIEIYILTNGAHTDIVMPIKNEIFDWSTFLSFDDILSKRQDFKFVAVGWGDKGFYLDTPTWAELKPSTAFKAAFWLSDSAMHCTYYDAMLEGENCVKIRITKSQYQRLVSFVKDKFDKNAKGEIQFIKTDAVYGKNDAFYDAKGSYNLFYTCNTWANDALKIAGQRAAIWTALDFGIFTHYQK